MQWKLTPNGPVKQNTLFLASKLKLLLNLSFVCFHLKNSFLYDFSKHTPYSLSSAEVRISGVLLGKVSAGAKAERSISTTYFYSCTHFSVDSLHMKSPFEPLRRTKHHTCPVIYGVSTKKQIASATSYVFPYLPSGIKCSISGFCVVRLEVISVSMNPGATMLTRMLRDATSLASDLVKPISPENNIKKM